MNPSPWFLLGPILLVQLGSPARIWAETKSELKDGYILVAPLNSGSAYLLNSDKEIVHQWDCGSGPGNASYLLADGSLLRTGKAHNSVFNAHGGAGGELQKISWDGQVVWKYRLSDDRWLAHHDVEPLPNGNILVIAWEYHSVEEAILAGRDPQTLSQGALWSEVILEVQPQGASDGRIVWQWRLWDHLIQQFDDSKANYGRVPDHPELVDINYAIRQGGADWIHMNSVDYNADLDQIVLSARWFNEAWVIDHSTTTAEAATHSGGKSGKGGDLLYRWGNPEAYYGGFAEDRQLFAQHDLRWIESGHPGAGNLLLFNNGDRRAGRNFSSVDEFHPPLNADRTYELSATEAFAPRSFVWSYSDANDFISNRISGAQRLRGGNTLICSGDQGWVFEVAPDGQRVWEFRLSDLASESVRGAGLFRAPYYPAEFPAFQNRSWKDTSTP